jgi:hypothetical protein
MKLKKSSPLKLLSQSQPNFAEMILSSSLCLYSSNLSTFWLKIEQFWPFEEISICKLEKRGDEIKKIFPSETTEPISTKLC